MICSLRIENFKALDDAAVELAPFTVLIGNNAAGKSTVLQAIDFLKYSCVSHAEQFLRDRGLTAAELCSFRRGRNLLSFAVRLRLDGAELRWELTFQADKKQNQLRLKREAVFRDGAQELDYQGLRLRKNGSELPGVNFRRNAETGMREPLMVGEYDCSLIRFVDVEADGKRYPALAAVKRYFLAMESLDRLSPDAIRGGSAGKTDTLGACGERLGALLRELTEEERTALSRDVTQFAEPLSAVAPKIRRDGRVSLEAKERYGGKSVSLDARSMSDGLLRLVAFCSLRYRKRSGGAILLDEIEDGINNESLERLVGLLARVCREKSVQIIATTHSTVLLDYVLDAETADADESARAAAILFLSRGEDGRVIVRDLLSSPAVRERLEYMYPGEIVLNLTNDELSRMLEDGKEA